ncbi:hypothetical protein J2Z62_000314 [Mycoplasmoides fastidiosum]|uniref:DUF31 domain-containing protein n=1 Tax=Mycoplasmoides fastidiosum TaxID=92758 RepID=A0ABU0LYT7_9BACT|nr:DUF31 family protein [Mycoplasmoides fastidiosum]MDQ0513876.1 hypothetical protein [Mycoplasmoides fastidiosum]UUD37710.1 DUF31 family protein [Mycoplasmoides fastidiosum]
MTKKNWSKKTFISLSLLSLVASACAQIDSSIPTTQEFNPEFQSPKVPKLVRPDTSDNNNVQPDPEVHPRKSSIEYSGKITDDDPTKFRYNYLPITAENKPNYHVARDYPANWQTNFQDQFSRQLVDGNYVINNQQIPRSTPRVQYNTLNRVFSTDVKSVQFHDWDYQGNVPEEYDTKVNANSENTVPNETYRKILKYSASLNFVNWYENESGDKNRSFTNDDLDLKVGDNGGTGWILDYQIPTDSSKYPTVWYYATNLHVIRALSSKSSYAPYQYDPKTNIITKETKLRFYPVGSIGGGGQMFNEALGMENKGPSYANPNSSKEVSVDAKILFTGRDFLKSKPHDFFPDKFDPSLEEFADFAVFEATFKDEAEAKWATQDYVAEPHKFSFLKQSYLSQPPKKWKSPDFYSAGYPSGGATSYPHVATNKNPEENGHLHPELPENIKNQGSPFANVRVLSSFTNHEGINDNLIGMNNLNLKFWGEKLTLGGLSYAIRHDAMRGGSSGGMVINEKNEIVSIHYSDWDKSDTGLSFVLKSERFLYNNIPNYYLADYDLIFGGGLDQKNSYKDALARAYSNKGIKTNLFPNGL